VYMDEVGAKGLMRVLMVGRKPSIALDELVRFWGEVEVSTNLKIPKLKFYDLVIAQEPTLRIGIPALIQARVSKAIFICEIHSNYLQPGFLPKKDSLSAKLVLREADYVRAVSKQIAANLKSWGLKNLLVIPSVYIRTDVFLPLKSQIDRGPVILSVARLVKQKGIELLIESVPYIIERFRDLEVRVVGDGPERKGLEKSVRENGLEDVVSFFGWVERDELVRHYNDAAVFVCTSHHEGGPRTVFEAAACKTPFVSTAVGIIPEVFQHGGEGFILHSRDKILLAKHIIRLLEDPVLREKMGSRGRKLVEQEFEWRKAVSKYAEAYLKIYDSRKRT